MDRERRHSVKLMLRGVYVAESNAGLGPNSKKFN